MADFVRCSNNGVTAIMPETTYEEWQKRLQQPHKRGGEPPTPIFSFVNPGRYTNMSPQWVTGDTNLMERLLDGYTVRDRVFYVPFSNGNDEKDAKFVTTAAQLMDTFRLITAARSAAVAMGMLGP